MPAEWNGFSIQFRYRNSTYEIMVDKQPSPRAQPQFTVDGQVQKPGRNVVDLVDDLDAVPDARLNATFAAWRESLRAMRERNAAL